MPFAVLDCRIAAGPPRAPDETETPPESVS
jgi:hypothetical protein